MDGKLKPWLQIYSEHWPNNNLAAGILDLSRGKVTHAFNPVTLVAEGSSRFLDSHPPSVRGNDLAWSSDGRILYKLCDDHTVLPSIQAPENASVVDDVDSVDADSVHPDNGWTGAELRNAELSEGCKAIYALDATPESRLRCPTYPINTSSQDIWGPPGFCLDWRACRDSCGSGAMHLWGRFEAGSTDCGTDISAQRALPSQGPLSGGVAMMLTGVSASSAGSLIHDQEHGILHLCSTHGLWETRVE
jgi:hypothetical protein